MSKDVLLIECERGNFHHVNDTSESKEMSIQFCADMKDALIELSTLTAKVKRYEDVIKKMADHCLCERSQFGFDYHEKHERLGLPKSGSRWLTPNDIARAALNQGEEEHE